MGSTKGGNRERGMGNREITCHPCSILPVSRPLFITPFFLIFFFLLSSYSVFSQNAVSLAAEISRLEQLSKNTSASDPRERYSAFLSLANLYKLSGDCEAAEKILDAALAAFPDDGRLLLEQGRLLLSMGEYEKAGFAVDALLKTGEREYLSAGRLLSAKILAFNKSPQALAAMSLDPDFADKRSDILYTLWKLTGLSSWKASLLEEFPQSPEAKIAAGAVNPATSPLWLLFPGIDSAVLSSVQPAPASPIKTEPAPSGAAAPDISSLPVLPETYLQAGLFSREENAKALAERLQKAGFASQIKTRVVNGSDFWAVMVSGGNDINGMIKKLKDAGFESFPAKS